MKKVLVIIIAGIAFWACSTGSDAEELEPFFREEIEKSTGRDVEEELEIQKTNNFYWVRIPSNKRLYYLFWKKMLNESDMILAVGFSKKNLEVYDEKLNTIMNVQTQENKWFGYIEHLNSSELKVREENNDGSIGSVKTIEW